jgi:hypothetical protein
MALPRRLRPTLVLLALTTTFAAQQPAKLDDILARVRANVTEYRTSIPNFSCDESIDSQHMDDGKVRTEAKIQSSFRMTRGTATNDLHETRVAHEAIVDGKPKRSG